MSNTYTVTATLQSPSSEPVRIPWATHVDALNASLAVAQLLAQHAEVPDTAMPESIRTTVRSIEIEVHQ